MGVRGRVGVRVCVRQGDGDGGEGAGEGDEWKKEWGGETNEKIIEDIFQAEAGLLRHTELINE